MTTTLKNLAARYKQKIIKKYGKKLGLNPKEAKIVFRDMGKGGREGFLAGYRAATLKWMPVKESLPEPGQEVFMYVNYELDGQRRTNLEYGYNDNGTWRGHRSVYSPGFVTHWMPIPKYPEEV
jgi:hypothetical protein